MHGFWNGEGHLRVCSTGWTKLRFGSGHHPTWRLLSYGQSCLFIRLAFHLTTNLCPATLTHHQQTRSNVVHVPHSRAATASVYRKLEQLGRMYQRPGTINDSRVWSPHSERGSNFAEVTGGYCTWGSSTSTSTICGDACPLSCASAEAYKLAQCTRPQGWGS